MMKLFPLILLSTIALAVDKDQEYTTNLIGMWAMEPVKIEQVIIANVTEYKSDGSYHLYSFKCTESGMNVRVEDEDETGTWFIKDASIFTTVGDPVISEKMKMLSSQIKEKLEHLSPRRREEFINSIAPEYRSILEGGTQHQANEVIVAMHKTMYKSSQKWIDGKEINYINHKVDTAKPKCDVPEQRLK